MNRELIKNEFINEVTKFISERNKNQNSLIDFSNKLTAYGEFEDKLFDILNSVLERNNIDLQEGKEQDDFIKYMKPTIVESIQKYITN